MSADERDKDAAASGPREGPASGERSDHHNAPPGVRVPGGMGIDPADMEDASKAPRDGEGRDSGEEPAPEAVDEDAANERGDE